MKSLMSTVPLELIRMLTMRSLCCPKGCYPVGQSSLSSWLEGFHLSLRRIVLAKLQMGSAIDPSLMDKVLLWRWAWAALKQVLPMKAGYTFVPLPEHSGGISCRQLCHLAVLQGFPFWDRVFELPLPNWWGVSWLSHSSNALVALCPLCWLSSCPTATFNFCCMWTCFLMMLLHFLIVLF